MGDFLFALLFPPILGVIVVLVCIGLALPLGVTLPRSFLKYHLLRIWRLMASFDIGINLLYFRLGAVTGSTVTLVICLLLDDDIRKMGRKAANLLGDKTRRIFESMRERMRVLEPLPGLTSFR